MIPLQAWVVLMTWQHNIFLGMETSPIPVHFAGK